MPWLARIFLFVLFLAICRGIARETHEAIDSWGSGAAAVVLILLYAIICIFAIRSRWRERRRLS